MKKIIVVFIICFILTGCVNINKSSFISSLSKKIKNGSGYKLDGILTVHNNDDVYKYKVKVLYKKDDNYKVTLTNTSNDHTQIILKNDDGVYVLTPALNKSFKFQSEWNYNNSQIYLLDTVLRDIKADKDWKFKKVNGRYFIDSKVNYPNNSRLVKQRFVFNNSFKPLKATVYDDNDVDCMSMIFNKVDYNPKFDKNDFNLDSVVKKNEDTEKTTGNLDDIIYPMFLPNGTKLVDEEKIDKSNGQRVIMSYDGEKSFLLVEETAEVFNDFTVVPTSGEPFMLMDTFGVMTDNSISWTSGGVDYYIVSDVMNQTELIKVAESLTTVASIK